MYHYLDDKEFLSKMRKLSGEIMQRVCHYLKEDYDIGASFYLVGSGARNLILQNENNPVDLDYNLEIVRCEDFEDCRHLDTNCNWLCTAFKVWSYRCTEDSELIFFCRFYSNYRTGAKHIWS